MIQPSPREWFNTERTKSRKSTNNKTHIIRMPSNTCHRRIMSLPNKLTNPPGRKNI